MDTQAQLDARRVVSQIMARPGESDAQRDAVRDFGCASQIIHPHGRIRFAVSMEGQTAIDGSRTWSVVGIGDSPSEALQNARGGP